MLRRAEGHAAEIIQKLSKLLVEGGKTRKMQQLMKSFGVDDTAMTFEETQKLYKEQSPIWLEAVTSLGLRRPERASVAQENSAPSPRIIGMKSGKLVAMKAVSSTLTGLSEARPITSADIAMR